MFSSFVCSLVPTIIIIRNFADWMSCRIQFNNEIGFLEIWDRIRKRITSDQCETQEFANMIDNLTCYLELVLENCKPKNREIYNALCCILREVY